MKLQESTPGINVSDEKMELKAIIKETIIAMVKPAWQIFQER